ncbi:hypothetical protein GCM10008027_04370 [Pseudoalteromonas gelatinilytica]|uniref:Uncharacterized protein n=1 Tax=Pseudoalteromonas gelatinilytica TaxID=1703256 RepID=A0ABQ1T5J8_9GAMM|nr:hypothetical protein GCM10008027_04370 [Pseudoalteromonas profundi]
MLGFVVGLMVLIAIQLARFAQQTNQAKCNKKRISKIDARDIGLIIIVLARLYPLSVKCK